MTLAEREMQRRGITQTALARGAGLHRTKLNKILRGREQPWPKYRDAIASAVGWEGDPAELFEDVEEV